MFDRYRNHNCDSPTLTHKEDQAEYMGQERRGVPRYPFTGVADIVLEGSGGRFRARMREISLYGCRLDTEIVLSAKTRVLVRIFSPTDFIEAAATVIFASLDLGMGLAFRKIEPDFEYVLKRWLASALEVKI